jgi:hypothetical protein
LWEYFDKMDVEVEVDETYIGRTAKNMHVAKRKRVITGTGGHDKTAVMGLLERARGAPIASCGPPLPETTARTTRRCAAKDFERDSVPC